MNAPQPVPPRRRLQILQAIPDCQRTDEQWDELNELEIMLAPGNREDRADPSQQRQQPSQPRRNNRPAQSAQSAQPKPASGPAPQGQKPPARKFHKRPPKPKPPVG